MSEHDRSSIARAAARGLVAAMAMTGMRSFAKSAGLMGESPPAEVVEELAPAWLRRIPAGRRDALTQLAHWGYGTAGGFAFGLLPAGVRVSPAAGPLYGLGIWLSFELGLAPLLGLQRRQGARHHAMLALDHTMYGLVVAGRLAPPPELQKK